MRLVSVFAPIMPAVVPKLTTVALANPVPVMMTVSPPAAYPVVVERVVITGTGLYVNTSPAPVALVPPGVITVT